MNNDINAGVLKPVSFENGIHKDFIESNIHTRNGDMCFNQISPMYQEKLGYLQSKIQMDIVKNQLSLNQRLGYEQNLLRIKSENKLAQDLIYSTVYLDASGKLIYAVTNPVSGQVISTTLLSVNHYRSIKYFSYYPKSMAVLEVSWENNCSEKVYFVLGPDGVSVQRFLKKLKNRGLSLLVSQRTEKQAANALFDYTLKNAVEIEVPYSFGWAKTKDGNWHFAYGDENCLRRILKCI